MEEKTEPERDPLTDLVIGAAIEVHKSLGVGLLESAYEACLSYELKQRGLSVRTQVVMPLAYKTLRIEAGYRIDLLVDEKLIVEIKALNILQEVHEAQILTYLRLSGKKTGLLLNFNVPLLKLGIRRFVM